MILMAYKVDVMERATYYTERERMWVWRKAAVLEWKWEGTSEESLVYLTKFSKKLDVAMIVEDRRTKDNLEVWFINLWELRNDVNYILNIGGKGALEKLGVLGRVITFGFGHIEHAVPMKHPG